MGAAAEYRVFPVRKVATITFAGVGLALFLALLLFVWICPDHWCAKAVLQVRAALKTKCVRWFSNEHLEKPAREGYRPDIDGLRAIAVLPVVLFHFQLGFPGGFVGVDVFFVISGYLIALILQRDLTQNRFSLLQFWERRVRRLLPALAVMVLLVFALGLIVFGPSDLTLLSKSVISQSTMLANVYFWRTTNYFSPGIESQPLAHLWSLAVEEQFYLVLPLILAACHRFWSVRSTRWVLGVLAVGSFVLSAHWVVHTPSTAFYLLPSRAWELLIGVLLALGGSEIRSAIWRELVSFAGLAAVLASTLFFHSDMTFPGPVAAIPCLGAAAVIWANSTQLTFTGRILAARPLVFIGALSYSLYLWHWPLSAFACYMSLNQSIEIRVLLVAASCLLGYLSWKWIEQPFRKGFTTTPRFAVLGTGIAVLCVTLGTGLFGWIYDGIPQRFSAETLAYFAARKDYYFTPNVTPADVESDKLIEVSEPKSLEKSDDVYCLVWGDSHARATLGTFEHLGDKHEKRVVAAVYDATAPINNYVCEASGSLKGQAPEYCENVLHYVRRHQVQHVVLIARWSGYWHSTKDPRLVHLLTETIREIQATGAQVWLMKEVPEFPTEVPRTLALTRLMYGEIDSVSVSLDDHRDRVRHVECDLVSLRDQQVRLLDPVPYLIASNGMVCGAEAGKVLYKDRHHLSTVGAAKLTDMFEPIFATTVANAATEASSAHR